MEFVMLDVSVKCEFERINLYELGLGYYRKFGIIRLFDLSVYRSINQSPVGQIASLIILHCVKSNITCVKVISSVNKVLVVDNNISY